VGTIVPGDRGRRGPSYTLLTPANRYLSRLPSLPGAAFYKLVTPRLAPARFGQYLMVAGEAAVSADVPPGLEHFIIGMRGEASVRLGEARIDLSDQGFIYIGPAQFVTIDLAPGASVIEIKRPYEPWRNLAEPGPVWGTLSEVERTPTAVPGLHRRELIDPTDPAFDFNISHMEFDPHVALAQIEIHDEEHGLYMTSGGGLYHLDGDEHDVLADDFIYMSPYCPQGFRAGAAGGSYLLYKDVYRDGFTFDL
jgi:(S)-ureidoglycine aminohydrolase